MNEKKLPFGVIIFGVFNLFILGIGSLIVAITPQTWQKVSELFKEHNLEFSLAKPFLTVFLIVQCIVSSIFIISGIGLLLGKEWARKLTLYFAFFLVVLLFLVALLNITNISLMQQAIINILYPGVLILYLTNKRIETYFKQ